MPRSRPARRSMRAPDDGGQRDQHDEAQVEHRHAEPERRCPAAARPARGAGRTPAPRGRPPGRARRAAVTSRSRLAIGVATSRPRRRARARCRRRCRSSGRRTSSSPSAQPPRSSMVNRPGGVGKSSAPADALDDRAVAVLGEDLLRRRRGGGSRGTPWPRSGCLLFVGHRDRVLDQDRVVRDRVVDRPGRSAGRRSPRSRRRCSTSPLPPVKVCSALRALSSCTGTLLEQRRRGTSTPAASVLPLAATARRRRP